MIFRLIFINVCRSASTVDFGVDQIDIKRKLLAVLGNDLLLQLHFSNAERGGTGTTSLSGKEIELTVAAVSEHPVQPTATI